MVTGIIIMSNKGVVLYLFSLNKKNGLFNITAKLSQWYNIMEIIIESLIIMSQTIRNIVIVAKLTFKLNPIIVNFSCN